MIVSPEGQVVRRFDLASAKLKLSGWARFSRDGSTMYVRADHEDGRRGIWAIPVAGGMPRLVIAFDDPTLVGTVYFSVGPDYLHLSVGQYESDIWVAKLRW